jgi:phosphoribosylamine-glycine ligase
MKRKLEIPSSLKVGIVGGGGREHAFVEALLRDIRTKRVFCFPGKDGYLQGDRNARKVFCMPDIVRQM